ncbi:MAG TPA: MFS transporter [Candidatus Limnocylindrales bacterium]|jgi:MFS transporter, DHA3 family, macrolide efflux protein|nr:MFS transporter [Candidatus Limnocylindrales bacterium]
MIIPGLLLGLLIGLLLGGRPGRLADVRLRWVGLILLALLLRWGTQAAISHGVELADLLRLPLYISAFGLLALATWLNRAQPGMLVIAVGAASNGLAMLLNGGWMPVWQPSLELVGLSVGDLNTAFHRPLPPELNAEFVLRGGLLGDLIPVPLPGLANVASVGDAFIGAGLGWFAFSALMRPRAEIEGSISLGPGRREQPLLVLDSLTMLGGARRAAFAPTLSLKARIRGHAYVRLALDPRFAAFWLGQAISLFGDRLHQLALAVLVYTVTGSPAATGLVFLAATLPNIALGPIAGTFVDRWDHKRVLIVTDLLRAGLVLAVPLALAVGVVWVYPLVFLITTISLFSRPAKVAVLPRIVAKDDLMAANSATWTADNLADIVGYPIAGLLVAFLGGELFVAFAIDAATYLLSALLVAVIFIPPVAREAAPRVSNALRTFVGELIDGWRFLRGEPPLIQNTLISALAQTSVGVTLALSVVYARDWLDGTIIPFPESYAAIETVIGVGNLIGGLAVGAIGARIGKGWLVVGGFVVMGLATIALGLTGNVALALVAALIMGAANLIFIVPTQTIFIERTPIELMGRVIAFRSSLVFGSMIAAMAISGLVAESVPVGLVIAASGALTAIAGLLGALLPAVRDA